MDGTGLLPGDVLKAQQDADSRAERDFGGFLYLVEEPRAGVPQMMADLVSFHTQPAGGDKDQGYTGQGLGSKEMKFSAPAPHALSFYQRGHLNSPFGLQDNLGAHPGSSEYPSSLPVGAGSVFSLLVP